MKVHIMLEDVCLVFLSISYLGCYVKCLDRLLSLHEKQFLAKDQRTLKFDIHNLIRVQ
jgi:hypothetical protein